MQVVTSASNQFPKSKHLLRHADFQQVYQAGRRQLTGNMTVFSLRRAEVTNGPVTGNSLRVGFTVGKVLGGSVERNRIKRRMREAVRVSWPSVEAPVDVVFHPRKAVLELPFDRIVTEVARGLQLAVARAREAQQDQPVSKAERK